MADRNSRHGMRVPPTDVPGRATSPSPARWPDRLATALALLAIAVAAWLLVLDAWRHPEALWRDPQHDRNTHLSLALDMALAARGLDPIGFLTAATREVAWPPLHPLLTAMALLCAGLDPRAAVLPAILGWAGTVALVWLTARRLAPATWLAGCVAAGYALTSPAFRLLGTDVMLETPGAALSALALYAFARGVAEGGWWPRLTCLALTALFYEKFNYWLLLAAALALTLTFDGGARAFMRRASAGEWPRVTRRLFAHPVGFAGLCLILLSLTLTLGGPDTIVLWDRPFLLRPPGHVLGLGYGLVLLRAVFVWCEERPWREGVLSPGARMVLGWHILPCALWFLTPQALLTFIWFVGPTHRGASAGYDPAAALLFHWRGFAGGFHLSYWSAALCLILAAIGLPRLLRGGPGERAVAMFALLSAAAVVLHPQQQARFQATGLFAVWICAGVGAGVGAGMLAAAWRAWVPRAPAWTGALAVAALFILTCLGPRAPSARVDAAAIRAPGAPSDLALSEAWLPLAGNTRGLGFIAPFARSDLFAWSVHARCRCRVPVEQPWLQPATTREEFAALTAAWLAGLAADHVILIDAPAQHPSPASVPRAQLLGARDALDTQTRFIASEAAPIAAGAATITVWRLAEGTAMPPAPQPRKLFGALSVAMALAILTRLALARLALARTR